MKEWREGMGEGWQSGFQSISPGGISKCTKMLYSLLLSLIVSLVRGMVIRASICSKRTTFLLRHFSPVYIASQLHRIATSDCSKDVYKGTLLCFKLSTQLCMYIVKQLVQGSYRTLPSVIVVPPFSWPDRHAHPTVFKQLPFDSSASWREFLLLVVILQADKLLVGHLSWTFKWIVIISSCESLPQVWCRALRKTGHFIASKYF